MKSKIKSILLCIKAKILIAEYKKKNTGIRVMYMIFLGGERGGMME